MKYLAGLIVAAAVASGAPVQAQITSTTPPLGITSPLGLGPGAPVGPVGVPLGATQLGTPGVSQPVPGSFVPGTMTGSNSGCTAPTMSTMTPGTSGSTAGFDGGGIAGTASGTCSTAGINVGSNPAASGSSPAGMGATAAVGRTGIPMGSSELVPGGLSPVPPVTTMTSTLPQPVGPTTSPSPMSSMMSLSTGLGGASMGSGFSPTAPTTGLFSSCPGQPGNVQDSSTPARPTFNC